MNGKFSSDPHVTTKEDVDGGYAWKELEHMVHAALDGCILESTKHGTGNNIDNVS